MRSIHPRSLVPIIMALLLACGGGIPAADLAAQDSDAPAITVTKKLCGEISWLPVFVESNCEDVPDATFELRDSSGALAQTLESGEPYMPGEELFGGSELWALDEVPADSTVSGTRVVSCLASVPGTGWHSSVPRVVHAEDGDGVLLDWMTVSTGVPNEAYRPSLDCIWFELPALAAMPAVLSLQAFTAESSYMNWTELAGPALPDLARGESGEDLEADMVMTNTDTGDAYSFAADAYGQVLVPAGTYSLVESASGVEEFFTMTAGNTHLVEIGLGSGAVMQPDPEETVAPEIRTFSTGVLYCEADSCLPVVDAEIHYESQDGSVQGSCVTQEVQGPNGTGAWCEYEYVMGIPTVLTLDTSTLPAEWVLISDNPQTYLVPVNPDGILSPVYFRVGPAGPVG